MKFFTSLLRRALRPAALVAVIGAASFMFDASAAYKAYTFCVDGIVYKTGTKATAELELTIQKATVKPTTRVISPFPTKFLSRVRNTPL